MTRSQHMLYLHNSTMMPVKRICLWSSPRNISTAMMYSFAQREDTIAIDEPLYAHYLEVTGIDHPGREETLRFQENDGEKVVRDIILGDYDKPIVFLKQMTHHLEDIGWEFLEHTKNILFIRDPKQIIASYAQVRPNVTMQDVGIEKQWQLFTYLTSNRFSCIVLDSNEILKSPQSVLEQLCSMLEIPFLEAMLHWPAGPKKEDGTWAKYWYHNVHHSTGFEKQKTSERELPGYLDPLYEECKVYYERLFPYSIKV